MNKFLYRTEGRFYLGDSNKQAQYVFQFRDDAPAGLRRSFVIEMKEDNNFTGSALEVANELKNVIDSYWLNSEKPFIKAVVEYLEKWEDQDRYDGLIAERDRLERRLKEIESELEDYADQETA